MNSATATLFFDQRLQKSNGKFPVKLTIYDGQIKKRYKTGTDLSPEDWKKINGSKLRDESLKETKIKLETLLSRASEIIKKSNDFSYNNFERDFFERRVKKARNSFVELFNEYMEDLEREERLGTRASYNTTLNTLLEFKKVISIEDVNKDFLNKFVADLQKNNKSDATIGIYLRNIRAIINYAISKNLLPIADYPFKGFPIPVGKNIKKALEWKDIKCLLEYKPTDKYKEKAFDLWLFSYLCNGMNMADIAHLQNANISGNFLLFKRRKTIRTKKYNNSPIKVALTKRANEIINKYASSSNPYLFGIINPSMEAVTIRNSIHRIIKFVNKYMKKIAVELKLDLGSEFSLTTYVARHSFATRLKRVGASIDEIGEYLGHSNPQTTKSYLDSFDDDLLVRRSQLLTEDVLEGKD